MPQTQKFTNESGTWFKKWDPHSAADQFEREAESLQALAEAQSGLIIPKVLSYGRHTANGPAFIIMEWLETRSAGSPQQQEQLGLGLAQLHQNIGKAFGFQNNNYCGPTEQDNRWQTDWVRFFGEQRIGHLLRKLQAKNAFSSAEMRVFDQLLQKLPNYLPHNPLPSLNHGDLWSGNCLYTQKGPALIDPAVYYADREFDLAMMQMFGGFSARVFAAYQSCWPLLPDWKTRTDLYMLYHYLNHYLLFGGGYGTQAINIAKKYN